MGKKQVSDRNKTFKIKDVEELTNQVLREVTTEQWKSIEHVQKVEHEQWEKDGLLDIEVEPLIIPVDDAEDEDDEEDIDIEVNECS